MNVLTENDYFVTNSMDGNGINDISKAINSFANKLISYGIRNTKPTDLKQNWKTGDMPVVVDFNSIENNLETLDVPKVFEKRTFYEGCVFDYTDANRYIAMCNTFDMLSRNVENDWKRCGMILGGDL